TYFSRLKEPRVSTLCLGAGSLSPHALHTSAESSTSNTFQLETPLTPSRLRISTWDSITKATALTFEPPKTLDLGPVTRYELSWNPGQLATDPHSRVPHFLHDTPVLCEQGSPLLSTSR
ncbi:hypothetical protein BJ508DRAFT_377544, partial [Ascobolus immersus RN42]